jgi:ParB-like chromosome segregation protein Spo0J
VGRFDQVAELAHAFRNGWDPEEPALVGYIRGNRIQLLSGTHRLAAALEVGLDRIPVVVWDYKDFDAAYGNLEKWFHLMASIKARDI